MTCTCCDGGLDSRDFDVRDVCDRCLGYLMAGVRHDHKRVSFEDALTSRDLSRVSQPETASRETSSLHHLSGRDICQGCPYDGCRHCQWQGGA